MTKTGENAPGAHGSEMPVNEESRLMDSPVHPLTDGTTPAIQTQRAQNLSTADAGQGRGLQKESQTVPREASLAEPIVVRSDKDASGIQGTSVSESSGTAAFNEYNNSPDESRHASSLEKEVKRLLGRLDQMSRAIAQQKSTLEQVLRVDALKWADLMVKAVAHKLEQDADTQMQEALKQKMDASTLEKKVASDRQQREALEQKMAADGQQLKALEQKMAVGRQEQEKIKQERKALGQKMDAGIQKLVKIELLLEPLKQKHEAFTQKCAAVNRLLEPFVDAEIPTKPEAEREFVAKMEEVMQKVKETWRTPSAVPTKRPLSDDASERQTKRQSQATGTASSSTGTASSSTGKSSQDQGSIDS